MSYERPAWAGGSVAPQHKTVNIDVGEFIRTRDALTSAYLGLSGQIDRAVKAYLDHTQVVLNADASLNISHLLQPFNNLTNHAQQMAQLALQQQNGGMPLMPMPSAEIKSEEPEGKKKRKKRNYKQRDPNAPKRPLTAYFRYLGEQRPVIQEEIKVNPDLLKDGKPGDISRIATERWKELTEDQREPYKQGYRRELEEYEEAVKKYKESGGSIEDLTLADAPGEELTPAAAEVEEDDDSSSDDSEDEDNTPIKPQPVAPAKTPKSSLKKSQQTVVPTPMFSSINPPPEPAKSSSPERKRKAAGGDDESSKKKRGRKSNTVVAGSDPPAPVAPMMQTASSPEAVPASDPAGKKKDKKKKKSKN